MKHVGVLALALGMAWASNLAHAQDAWPSRAITFIVPYGPGGYTDLVGRLTARYVEKALGKPVIVESRVGAGGIVGTQYVASAAPDGYTFCVCSVGAVSIAPFAQKLGYDPVQDLAPVGIVSTIVQAVIVKKDLPVKSMADLVAYAKANPGKLNYGSSGVGGLTHYSVELFQARTGTKAVHIPFKGGAQSTAAVLAGEDAGADHPQDVGGPDQDGRRPGCQGNHAQGRRQHGQDHARAIPRADPAGDGAVAAADQGNRGQEVIG